MLSFKSSVFFLNTHEIFCHEHLKFTTWFKKLVGNTITKKKVKVKWQFFFLFFSWQDGFLFIFRSCKGSSSYEKIWCTENMLLSAYLQLCIMCEVTMLYAYLKVHNMWKWSVVCLSESVKNAKSIVIRLYDSIFFSCVCEDPVLSDHNSSHCCIKIQYYLLKCVEKWCCPAHASIIYNTSAA